MRSWPPGREKTTLQQSIYRHDKARCSLSKPTKARPTIKDKLAELKRLEKENAELKRRRR